MTKGEDDESNFRYYSSVESESPLGTDIVGSAGENSESSDYFNPDVWNIPIIRDPNVKQSQIQLSSENWEEINAFWKKQI